MGQTGLHKDVMDHTRAVQKKPQPQRPLDPIVRGRICSGQPLYIGAWGLGLEPLTMFSLSEVYSGSLLAYSSLFFCR